MPGAIVERLAPGRRPTANDPPPGTRPTRGGLSDRWRRVIVALLVLAYAAFFSALTIARHLSFDSGAFDLGFMDQAAWNTLRGHIMGVSIELWTANTHLGYHFDPILIPISLAYLVYSNPASLLVVQSVGLALGAFPASWIARRRLGSNWAAVAFAAAYLLYPGLEAANVYDFHAFTLAAPLVLLCFYFIEMNQLRAFAVAAVFTMATKENVPLTTLMLGLYLIYPKRRLWPGVATVIASIAWFFAATYVVIPYFNSEGQGWLWNRYGGMGGSPLQIIGFLLENPLRLIEPAPGISNISYVVKLLLPLGFLSLLDPFSLLVGAPGLATNVLTVYEPMHMLETYHYTSSLVPVVVVSAIFGTERAARLWSRVADRLVNPGLYQPRRHESRTGPAPLSPLIVLLASLGVIACSLAYHYYRGYTPLSPGFSWPRVTEHHAIGEQIARSIPPDAAVSAQSNVYPHASERKMIWMFPYVGPADYIFLDVASQPNSVGLNDNFHQVLQKTLDRPDFGAVVARDGYLLLQRGAPHRGLADLPDEFFDFARAKPAAGGSPSNPQHAIDARFGQPGADPGSPAVRLIGYDLQTRRDAGADLTLYWQATGPIQQDLFFPVYITDGHGHEQGATLYRQPANVWYPTNRWQPGETVRLQTIALPWFPDGRDFGLAVGVIEGKTKDGADDPWDQGRRWHPVLASASTATLAPAGGTLLELVTFKNDRGLIRPEWRPRVQDTATPTIPEAVVLGGAARLVGYDVGSAVPGKSFKLTLHWQAVGRLDRAYTVFTHVLNASGQVVAQRDSPPAGGLAPTTLWLPGDTLADEYQIDLPADLPAGDYRIEVGMYDPGTGQRLPAVLADGKAADSVILGRPLSVGR